MVLTAVMPLPPVRILLVAISVLVPVAHLGMASLAQVRRGVESLRVQYNNYYDYL